MPRFPMLDVFVRQFLLNVNALARAGLARRYVPVEENLPICGDACCFGISCERTFPTAHSFSLRMTI